MVKTSLPVRWGDVKNRFRSFFEQVAAKRRTYLLRKLKRRGSVSLVATSDLGRCPKTPRPFWKKVDQKLSKVGA
jgi:hypothetical protein